MTAIIIRLELLMIFSFAVIAGASISYTIDRVHEADAKVIAVHLLSLSLHQLSEESVGPI